MDRYSILLGKTPPPKPKVKKPEKIITRSNERASSRGAIPAAQRDALISQYMATAEGRARLAASMVHPMRERLNYQSVARRIFQVDPLPDGALPVYNKDPDVPGYVISERDQETVIPIALEEQRIYVPMFEILSRPSVPLSSVRQRRFNLIERAQDLAVSEIRSQEEVSSLTLLDAATRASSSNIITPDFTTARIIHTAFVDSYALIERHDMRVGNVFMNAIDFAKIRRFVRDTFDPETNRAFLRQGILGTMWGAQIIISRIIPAGQIYVTAESQFIGHMPLRELTVLSADNPRQRTIGWACMEGIGICCVNPRGMAKITISSDASVDSREETNAEEDWMTFSESDSKVEEREESSEEN